jgi:phosphoribosyl-dephospho-CoA transferase
MNPRVHYLLEIDVPAFLEASPSAPEWVAESLAAAPFVVVRRGFPTQHLLPVGVRGEERNQRWAGMCALSWIRSALSPADLISRARFRIEAIPALRSLSLLASHEAWNGFPQEWGPGGSVGFELATGRDTATPQSDLDMVIYADERFSAAEAKRLHAATQFLPSTVDVRVETPVCGFALTEYATQTPAPILLRTASGVMLGADPWDGAPASASGP